MDCFINISLISDVTISDGDQDGQLILETPPRAHRPRVTLNQVSTSLKELLQSLTSKSSSVPLLIGLAMQGGGPAAIGKLTHYLGKMAQHAMLRHTLHADGDDIVTVEPQSTYYLFNEEAIDEDTPYMLSRFACCRNDNGTMILECSTGFARIYLQSPMAQTLLHHLSRPRTVAQLAAESGTMDAKGIKMFMTILANANALAPSPDGSIDPYADDPVMAQWEFHDLLFHTRTRLGRHSQPYGGTYPFMDKFTAPPAIKPPMSDEIIKLYTPDMQALNANDAPFSQVLEQRASIRELGDPPISLQQLGEFLYRAARVKKLVEDAGISWRPTPGGGAIHELDIYPLISHCDGIKPGLYHYNPLEHFLSRAAEPGPMLDTLAHIASITARLEGPPQILFVITARFQRIQIKYQSMAYAAILKNVGALYQTFYLVASAMGLGPCALGGGHSDLFAQAAGLHYYEETSVGEFVLNSRAQGN